MSRPPADANRTPEQPRWRRSDAKRDAIMSAAERLFAERGYDGTSVRDIAALAEVNSALVGYYFGSKEQLYRGMFERQYHGITGERLSALARVTTVPGSVESLRSVARAWIQPLVRRAHDPATSDFVMVIARESNSPAEDPRGILGDFFDPSARVCIEALSRVAPEADRQVVVRGYLLMIACTFAAISKNTRMQRLAGVGRPLAGSRSKPEADALVALLVDFAAAGMHEMFNRASAPESDPSSSSGEGEPHGTRSGESAKSREQP